VIKSVLKPDEIVQGSHSPEIILTDSPSGVVDWDFRLGEGVRLVIDDFVSVDDDDLLVLEEGVGVSEIHVAIEEQKLHIVRVEILTEGSKPVDLVVIVLLDYFGSTPLRLCVSEILAVVEDLLGENLVVFVLRKSLEHLLRFSHVRQDTDNLGGIRERCGSRIHLDVEGTDTNDTRTDIADLGSTVIPDSTLIDPFDSTETVAIVDVV
jgi:hypothetical protein